MNGARRTNWYDLGLRGETPYSQGLIAYSPFSVEAVRFNHGYTNIAHYCVGRVVTRRRWDLLGPWAAAVKSGRNGENRGQKGLMGFWLHGFMIRGLIGV